MSVQLKPETERMVQEEIRIGHFRSIDELIVEGIHAWRKRHRPQRTNLERRQAVERALDFAKHRAVPLKGISITELIHEGHRV